MKLHAPGMTAVCLALAVLLVSCPSPLGNATMGTIRLSFSGASRGMIEPPEVVDPTLAIKTLLVEITGPGMEKMTSQPVAYDTSGTTLTMPIPAGPGRAVTISARNEAGTTLYSQTQTVTIVAGKEMQVAFNLDGILYSVAFEANGGSGPTMAPQSIAYGSKAALTPNSFTKAGYSFVGWATSATTNANYADKADYTMGTTGATLFAVWNVIISGQFTGSVLDSGPKNNGGIPVISNTASSAASFTSSSGNLTYGSYSVTTQGDWTYSLDTENSTVNALAVGSSLTDTFTIDAGGTTQIITITIWGADETSNVAGQYIQGDGSGSGGGGASGAYLGGAGGAGGGDNDTLTGTAGNDIIFGDGSGGGKGGRGVGADDLTGTGAGLGGGGADSINGGTGDDIIFGDGFNGTMDQWNAGKGGFGGGGGGGSGGNLGTYLGAIGGLGAGSGSGYAGSVAPLIAGFGNSGGSGTTPGGNSATSIAFATGTGGASFGPGNGHGGGGGFGGSSGGAGASTTGPGNAGENGNTAEHRYDDSTGSIHAYILGRLATLLTDFPAYGAGVDTLDGGAGSDHLFGLGGADTFVFELDDAYSGNDIDTIWDFNKNAEADQLRLLITGVAIGTGVRDALIAAQITEGADRKLVFSDGISKTVTIVIKNLGRDIVAGDFE